MDKNLKQLFNSTCDAIDKKLKAQVDPLRAKAEKQFYKENGMADIQKQQEDIEKQIEKLQTKLYDLKNEENKVDRRVMLKWEALEVYNVINRGYHSARTTWYEQYTSEEYAYKALIGTKEYNNYKAWLEIKKGFEYTINLAISPTEQRNLIIQLQSYDWRSLGIDMPPQFINIAGISISNGMITVNDTTPALPSVPKKKPNRVTKKR